MVIDASALCAIIGREEDWERFQVALTTATTRLTHPVSLLEAAIILPRLTGKSGLAVEAVLADYRQLWGIGIAPVDAEVGQEAIAAYRIYGKGRGHPARLNLGDCFSYAIARRCGLPLLFKGDDFTQTDVARVL